SDTAFAGSLFGYIANLSANAVEATGATFGGVPALTATLAQQYAIVDKILDAVDVSGLGLVRTKAGNVYVTPGSFYAPLGTTTPNIQRGVNVASSGNTVHVEAGSYNNDVTIGVSNLSLIGDGQASTTVSGPIGGSGTTIAIAASNVQVAGFK